MTTMTREIRQRIVDLLTSRFDSTTLDTIATLAFADTAIIHQLPSAKNEALLNYVNKLVNVATQHGEIDGEPAIIHLLREAKKHRGEDVQRQIDAIITGIEALKVADTSTEDEADRRTVIDDVHKGEEPSPATLTNGKRSIGCNLAVAGFIVAVIGLCVAILQVLPESTRERLFDPLFGSSATETPAPTASPTLTPVPTIAPTATPIPPNETRRSLNSAVNVPVAFTVAPYADSIALWGIDASGRLFALDTGTGDHLPIGEGDATIFTLEGVSPVGMYFDGAHLWIVDALNNRVIVIEPDTLAERGIWELAARPTSITGVADMVWVALNDGTVQAGRLADDGSVDEHCPRPVAVGANPGLLTVDGQTALWVATGDVNAGQIQRVNLVTCRVIDDAIEIEAGKPSSLALFGGQLWFTAGDVFGAVETGSGAVRIIETVSGVTAMLSGTDGLWLMTANQLIVYDPANDTIANTIMPDSPPTHLVRYGSQIWLFTEDRAITRYLFPDAVYAGLVDIASAGNNLWLIDADANLCLLIDDAFDCTPLDIDAEPRILTNATAPNALWLATADGGLWQIDLNQRQAERIITLDEGAPQYIAEESRRNLWASDGFAWLVRIDLSADEHAAEMTMPFNFPAPDIMTAAGGVLWAFSGDTMFSITLDDGRLVQETSALRLPFVPVDASTTSAGQYLLGRGTVAALSPLTGEIIWSAGSSPLARRIAVVGADVWVAEVNTGAIFRLGSPD